MGKFQTQYQAERSPFDKQELGSNILVAAGIDYLEGSAKSRSVGGEVINESDTSTGLFFQRQERRKDDTPRWTEKVRLPQIANLEGLEGLPDDGFSWKKYGQKDILGSKYLRNSKGCLATKQIQRMDDNPNEFEVTYRGRHTCHKSSTVLSIGPLPSSVADQISPEVAQLSMDSLGSGSLMTVGPLPSVADQISSDVTQLSMDSLGRGSFMTVASGRSGADLSTVQSGKEVESTIQSGKEVESTMDWIDDYDTSWVDEFLQPPKYNK